MTELRSATAILSCREGFHDGSPRPIGKTSVVNQSPRRAVLVILPEAHAEATIGCRFEPVNELFNEIVARESPLDD
jgi:hypothetical protein